MTTYSREDLIAIQRCNVTTVLCEALRQTRHLTNAQDQARAMVTHFEKLARGDKLDVIALLTLPKIPPPVQPTRKLMADHAHGDERPAARGI